VLHRGREKPGMSIATALKTKAAPTPMAISVNMFK
jgi:hypothetical protein